MRRIQKSGREWHLARTQVSKKTTLLALIPIHLLLPWLHYSLKSPSVSPSGSSITCPWECIEAVRDHGCGTRVATRNWLAEAVEDVVTNLNDMQETLMEFEEKLKSLASRAATILWESLYVEEAESTRYCLMVLFLEVIALVVVFVFQFSAQWIKQKYFPNALEEEYTNVVNRLYSDPQYKCVYSDHGEYCLLHVHFPERELRPRPRPALGLGPAASP